MRTRIFGGCQQGDGKIYKRVRAAPFSKVLFFLFLLILVRSPAVSQDEYE
jgi:hypothetical protein